MEFTENTYKTLIQHSRLYPTLEIADIFKFLYQSSFGCEHMISNVTEAIERIRSEEISVENWDGALIDELDGCYSRIHLSYLKSGLSAETLGKLFFLSAKKEPLAILSLEKKLDTVQRMAHEGILPFSPNDIAAARAKWRTEGYPSLHHSNTFKSNYHPAYRVISNQYVPFLPLLSRIDTMLKNGSVKLAIEGGSASGKTTLAELLYHIYDCALIHMDDFFLRAEQRTPERFAEPGGNIDRERFLDEVLIPMSLGNTVSYRPFDCSSFKLLPSVTLSTRRLTVIEGVYSMHPAFAKYYDISVFLDILPELQRERIKKRNSPYMAQRFFDEWIPLEHTYFEKLNIRSHCDITVPII